MLQAALRAVTAGTHRYNYKLQGAIATIIASGIFIIVLICIVQTRARPPSYRVTSGHCRPETDGIITAHYYHSRVYWTVQWDRAHFVSPARNATCYNLTSAWTTAQHFNHTVEARPCWARSLTTHCTVTLYNPNHYSNPEVESHRRSWYTLYILCIVSILLIIAAISYVLWDYYQQSLVAARQADYQNISTGNLFSS